MSKKVPCEARVFGPLGGNMPIPGPKNGEKEGKVVSFLGGGGSYA